MRCYDARFGGKSERGEKEIGGSKRKLRFGDECGLVKPSPEDTTWPHSYSHPHPHPSQIACLIACNY